MEIGPWLRVLFSLFTVRFAPLKMALASGLTLVTDDRRRPMTATTWGTRELTAAAIQLCVAHIAVRIGGSATNDGGIGMAAALGVLCAAFSPAAPVAPPNLPH